MDQEKRLELPLSSSQLHLSCILIAEKREFYSVRRNRHLVRELLVVVHFTELLHSLFMKEDVCYAISFATMWVKGIRNSYAHSPYSLCPRGLTICFVQKSKSSQYFHYFLVLSMNNICNILTPRDSTCVSILENKSQILGHANSVYQTITKLVTHFQENSSLTHCKELARPALLVFFAKNLPTLT